MKNPVVILIIPLFLLQGCRNIIDPSGQDDSTDSTNTQNPCHASNYIYEDSTYIYGTLVNINYEYIRQAYITDSLYYGKGGCGALKIIRDEKTFKSLINYSKYPVVDFCDYTVIAGNILQNCGYLSSKMELTIHDSVSNMNLNYIGSGTCTLAGGLYLPFVYIVPLLPDSISILFHVETYERVYHSATDKTDTVLRCTSDKIINEF